MARKSNQPVQFHATKQALIDTVQSLLETQNPSEITSEQVLARARISSGSLYHHFADFHDLIEQVLCIEYEQFTERTIDLLLMTNEQATNIKNWAEGVVEARRISHGQVYERNRALRVWAVAYATSSERMKKRLGDAQDRLNAKFVKFIEDAQSAGWVKSELDPLALAVFIQAYTFGSVIDDVAGTKMQHEMWIDLLNRVSRDTFING
ncbi:MAG: TetR/AcrR family transcriptional regulator [Micrococcales bacterium]